MRRRARRRWQLAALLVGALSAACGGGGGGGGGPTTPPTPTGISFSATRAPSSPSLYLERGGATTFDRLFLEVRVNDVEEFYGVAFDLVYPTNLLSFVRARENNFLRGNTELLQVEDRAGGRVIIGYSNLGTDPPESGSGLLLTIEFAAVSNGSGPISFDNEQAFQRASVPYTIDFIAGTVSVRR